MATAGLSFGVVGATGALGSEILEVLGNSILPVSEIVPLATDLSLGAEIEFQGDVYPVETDESRLAKCNLIFLCTPKAVSLDFIHRALEARVACIDLSGALSHSEEVPMRVAGYGAGPDASPVISIPVGPALAWVMVLQPLVANSGVRRVVGTLFEAASTAGRRGTESLYAESVTLFNHQDPPDPSVFPGPVAYDCLPGLGERDAAGSTAREVALVDDVGRLLGPEVKIAVTAVQVPIFVGHGSALAVETERDLEPGEAEDLLRKAPGVEVWGRDDFGPTTRGVAGRDVVMVGRVRRDPSHPTGLLLWLSADPLRLAASHAIQLAALRFS